MTSYHAGSQCLLFLQEKLLALQDERRRIGQELTDIRKESNSLQDQIHRVKRHEDYQRFLDLMRAETEVLKREQEVVKAFGDCDKYEREIFTAFTSAIRDSHEKQRAQVEYTKYFGLVLGILGSFLTFIYSTYKKYDLKWFLEEKLMALNSLNYGKSSALMQELNAQVSRLVASQDSHNASVIEAIDSNFRKIKGFLTTGLDYTHSSVSPKSPVLEESSLAVKAALVGAVGLTTIVVLKVWCG